MAEAPSLPVASHWFDSMTLYLDQLLEIQQDVAVTILDKLDSRTSTITTGK